MNTRRAPYKGFSLQPDASAPAAVSRLSRAVAGVPIAARHAHATEPHFGNAGAVSSQSNKPHLNPGFSARNSEQMVSEFAARHVSPM